MSNQELDNLFKNKLEEFGQGPPQDLWNKIDEQLEPKKKKPIIWFMSIAASLLLLAAFGVFFHLNDKTISPSEKIMASIDEKVTLPTPNQESAIEKVVKEDEGLKESKNSATLESITLTTEKEKVTNTESVKKEEAKPVITKVEKVENIAKVVIEKVEIKPILEELPKKTAITEIITETQIAKNNGADATLEGNDASDSAKGKTLVFDISDFAQQDALAKNDDEEKKESRLRKIFNIAKDIKSGESGLKDIREAKNGLFALGSKKEEESGD